MKEKNYKILYLHNQTRIGGGEISLMVLFKEMMRKNIEVLVACPPMGRFYEAVDAMGIKVFPFFFGGLSGKLFLINCMRLVRIIKKHDISLLHGNSPQTNIPAGIAGRLAHVPIVWHARVLMEPGMIDIDRLFFFLPSRIICNSNAIKQRFKNKKRIASKTVVIHNGVDTSEFSPVVMDSAVARERFSIDAGSLVIACFDRLDPVKDHETILKAIKSVYEKYKDILLLIVGEAFDDHVNRRNQLINLTKKLGIDSVTHFYGFLPDIRQVMAACDLVVQASRLEGCSRSICEAQAMGKPVIASNTGGNPEIVKNGVTGYLFPVADHEKISFYVKRLIEDVALRKKMGDQAREHALRSLSLERYCHETDCVYLKLLK